MLDIFIRYVSTFRKQDRRHVMARSIYEKEKEIAAFTAVDELFVATNFKIWWVCVFLLEWMWD